VVDLSEEKLANFLRTAKDWARLVTSIPGVFVLKLPQYQRSPTRLTVEINPVDASGRPTKRRGLVVRSMAELDAFKDAFQYEKLAKLLTLLDAINPPVEAVKRRRGEDVLEL
jgi:hypothetical protein